MITDALFQAILYIPLVLGIFLSFKLLRLTDLTADGSFVLGAGIYARLFSAGVPYGLAFCASVLGGFLVGAVLAFIQKNNRVPSIVASILCVFMLYSLNLLVMGRPTISLLSYPQPFSQLMDTNPLLFQGGLMGFMGVLMVGFFLFMNSPWGLVIRAFGVNYALTRYHGYKPERIRTLGLGLSNALYAMSGGLCAQIQNFADLNMGLGVALMGIGAVILGIQLFVTLGILDAQRFQSVRMMGAVTLGIFLYFLLMHMLLALSVDPVYLKLVLGIVLTVTFIYRKGFPHDSYS